MASLFTRLRRTGWIVAELLIVFVGVLGAFWVEEYREQQQAEARAAQFYEMLREGTERSLRSMRDFQGVYDSVFVQGYLDSYEQGERPVPIPITFDTGKGPERLEEALLLSGGFEVVDVELLKAIKIAQLQTDLLLSSIETTRNLVSDHVLPVLGDGAAAFYDPETGDLRPRYQWYPKRVRNLGEYLGGVVAAQEDLVKELNRQRDG